MIGWDGNLLQNILGSLVGPLIVGLVIWLIGKSETEKRIKNEAIRDLMTYRGDLASLDFRRSLNRVSITFHKDEEIRKQIRDLYENINNPVNPESNINRKIVSLIYNLCQKNDFLGITEYDIDQSFPELKQTPSSSLSLPHQIQQKISKKKSIGKHSKKQS